MSDDDEREHDPVRLLAQRSELGYVDRVDLAMRDEPEAVRAETQRDLTARSRRAWQQGVAQRWKYAAAAITSALTDFASGAEVELNLADDLRGVERSVERVSRRIAGL